MYKIVMYSSIEDDTRADDNHTVYAHDAKAAWTFWYTLRTAGYKVAVFGSYGNRCHPELGIHGLNESFDPPKPESWAAFEGQGWPTYQPPLRS